MNIPARKMAAIAKPGFAVLLIMLIHGCAVGTGSSITNSESQNNLLPSMATGLDTGYLQATPGFKGDVIGAKVESVDTSPDGQFDTIAISVPLDPQQVDQVQVISGSGKIIKQPSAVEVVRDYENNKVEIRFLLSKQNNFGFKLKLIDLPDDN